ncbi:hypothetical protein [Streptomyces triticiradicis]|uniref:Uncharacterized protein n=1 Tax=Streptomyces triticiradicis TaxID=2651189 RepID=A0A7J5DEZ2_9ACTN|nr:hypothetical protein [Streptomyces triticiradicis]KAB1987438.1 hypothetical protein F8144_17050 [Streptomyces triticiradicis]
MDTSRKPNQQRSQHGTVVVGDASAMSPGAVNSIAHSCSPWLVLALLAALAASLPFWFTLSIDRGERGKQKQYIEEIGRARQDLFTGQLVYTDVKSLQLEAGGEPRLFRVDVLGRTRSAKPGEEQAPLKAGAQIGVKLHCAGTAVRCAPLSSERQSVLSKEDRATWMWEVSSQHPGKITIAFTVTAYLGDGNTVLVEKPPLTSRVEVAEPSASWFSWVKDFWGWAAGAIATLGGMAVSLSAIVAVIVMVIRRRLPDASAAEPSTPEPERRADRRPRVVVTRSARLGPRRSGRRAPRE